MIFLVDGIIADASDAIKYSPSATPIKSGHPFLAQTN